MTKEQAIELCKQIWCTSGLHNSFRVLRPGIGNIDDTIVTRSFQERQVKEWAALFRELAEALDPAMVRAPQSQTAYTDPPPVFMNGSSKAAEDLFPPKPCTKLDDYVYANASNDPTRGAST